MLSPLPDLATWLWAVVAQPQMGLGVELSSVLAVQSAHFLFSMVMGLTLILVRKAIAQWLSPEPSTTDTTAQALFAVGVSLLGVMFLVSGITSIATLLIIQPPNGMSGNVVHTERFWQSISDAIAGLCLFVFSVNFARLWQWLRGRLDKTG